LDCLEERYCKNGNRISHSEEIINKDLIVEREIGNNKCFKDKPVNDMLCSVSQIRILGLLEVCKVSQFPHDNF